MKEIPVKEIPVEECSFSELTDCFSYILLFNNSKLKWYNYYTYSQVKSFPKKSPFQEKSKIQVQNSMKIIFWHCRFVYLKSNPVSRKSSYTRYLLIQEKNQLFTNIYFRKSDKRNYFVYIKFYRLSKSIHLTTHINLWNGNISETCDDFCNFERYSKVIWKSQHSTSAMPSKNI